jgi:hypothetical protein
MSAGRSQHWLRRVALVLLWAILLLVATVAANVVGIHLAGSIEGWMHRRVLAREPEAGKRLLRAEIAAIAAVAALEIGQFVQAG